MAYLLALDQGTTSSRAIIFTDRHDVVSVSQRELEQHYPRAGWVEHDPMEIWRTQIEVAREALGKAQIRAGDLAAIGITNQRETTVIWDRASGVPIYNAIVWQDRRTAALCDELLHAGHEEKIREKTGLLLDPYFSASKIRWLLDHCDGARQAADAGRLAFGTIDSWLVWHLTGGKHHLTDATNASRTLLYNINEGDWDEELLALWDIPRTLMPEIRDSSGICATTRALGDKGVPIAGIAGDQHAALFGQACFEPGMAKCTYGTGCFILMHTGRENLRSRSRLLTTVAWSIDGQLEYAIEGSVFMGGALVQWLRDGLGIIESAAQIETLAARVADSDGVVLVPAFAGLGAPHWDPHARGTLIGMTRGTTAAHIARAALEGIAAQVADVLDAMRRDTTAPLLELKVDGGAAINDLLMQIQCDLIQVPLTRPRILESSAFGAAALAGLGVDVWPDRSVIAEAWREERRFEPEISMRQIEARRAQWKKAVERAKGWAG